MTVQGQRLQDMVEHSNIKQNLLDAEVLIIDEISLISTKALDQIEVLCCKIRKSDACFGKIQVIVCGDFRQLKPVPSTSSQDPGEFCFLAQSWKNASFHTIQLTEVQRQKDEEFVKAIHELSEGGEFLSEESIKLLTSLSRNIPVDRNVTTYLNARKFECEITNYDILYDELNGPLSTFRSKDNGDKKYLKSVQASKTVVLRVGCKVICIANILPPFIVNGSVGKVVAINDKNCEVTVDFEDFGNYTVSPITFKASNENGTTVATRSQIPLKLGYALTIHRAQGLNLESAVVNAQHTYQPGQLATAIGRVKSRDNIQLINFDPKNVPMQPEAVRNFYNGGFNVENVTQNVMQPVVDEEDFTDEENEDTDDTDDTDDDSSHEDNTEGDNNDGDSDDGDDGGTDTAIVDICAIQNKFKEKFLTEVVTQEHKDLKTEIENIEGKNLQAFLDKLWTKYQELGHELQIKDKRQNKDFSKFITISHKYLKSKTHLKNIAKLLQCSTFTSLQLSLARQYSLILQHKFIESLVPDASDAVASAVTQTASDASKAAIRYIGGMCFAKRRYKSIQAVLRNVTNVNQREMVRQNRLRVEMLESHIVPQDEIKSSTIAPETLATTLRKQNLRQGLTHITDQCFTFFEQFDACVGSYQNESYLKRYRSEIFKHVEDEIYDDDELFAVWCSLFPSCDNTFVLKELFVCTTKPYLHVRCKQYRKELVDKLRGGKSLEIRKAIFPRKSLRQKKS